MPKAVLNSVNEYRREMDVISTFIDACCVVGEGESVNANKLFAVYSQWCDTYCEYRMSSTKFGMEMSKRFNKIRTSAGRSYRGINVEQNCQSGFCITYR